MAASENIYKILLFTNKDSDNMGDKVIEKCDIALIQVVMKNVGIENYAIKSYDAQVMFNEDSETLIQETDLVLLGGAPLLNYIYQDFYERTIITIELAEKYHKPVVFSAIGIDSYSETSVKCQEVKEALNKDCVKQITTRDGYEFLKQYKDREELVIGKVADPAVWTSVVFKNFLSSEKRSKKKIGIFVIRSEGFTDNGIHMTRKDLVNLYKGIAHELECKGYEYEFITSGHFNDEAFLDYLVRYEGVDIEKCVFNMNTPEKLVNKISSYDGVISCRLHPSIIAYSLGIPSVGLVWNPKVEGFYNSIGYHDRLLYVEDMQAEHVVDYLEKSMQEGVNVSEDYLMSTYHSLYNGIILALNNQEVDIQGSFDFKKTEGTILPFEGTDNFHAEEYLEHKFRRIYKTLNDFRYQIIYNGGTKSEFLDNDYNSKDGSLKKLEGGTLEYWSNEWLENTGEYRLMKNHFFHPDYAFIGWRMRIKVCNDQWLWYLKDGSFILTEKWSSASGDKMLFKDEAVIPKLPFDDIMVIVMEAVWNKKHVQILYNSGKKSEKVQSAYSAEDGEVKRLSTGTYEFCPVKKVSVDGTDKFEKNQFTSRGSKFLGWRLRLKIDGEWYWYLSDGSLSLKDKYESAENRVPVQIFADEDYIPCVNKNVDTMVAEAAWENKIKKIMPILK